MTLASLIPVVSHLTLGTAILVLPQRNTILVAKQAAALHLLSRQRLILGVGIGHRADEFAILDANFLDRGALADEAIEVLRMLWRVPNASYHGRFHSLDAVNMPPYPPDGGPPIWISGNSLRAVQRTARYGQGWLPFGIDLDAFRSGVGLLRELTHAQGCPTIANEFYLRIEKPEEPAMVHSTSPWVEGRVAGSPDTIVEHLEHYRQAGLEYALCLFESEDLHDLLRQMHLFAEQVMPQITAAEEGHTC